MMSIGTIPHPSGPGSRQLRVLSQERVQPSTSCLNVTSSTRLRLHVRPPRSAFQTHLIFALSSMTGGVTWKLKQETLQQARLPPTPLPPMRINISPPCGNWQATSRKTLLSHRSGQSAQRGIGDSETVNVQVTIPGKTAENKYA